MFAGIMEHAKVFGADECGRVRGSVRGGISFWRLRSVERTVTCWAVGEGGCTGCCAAEDELLRSWIADYNRIVMSSMVVLVLRLEDLRGMEVVA